MKQFGDFLILFLDCVWGRHRGRAVSSGVLFFASCLKRPLPAFLYFGKLNGLNLSYGLTQGKAIAVIQLQ